MNTTCLLLTICLWCGSCQALSCVDSFNDLIKKDGKDGKSFRVETTMQVRSERQRDTVTDSQRIKSDQDRRYYIAHNEGKG